MMTVVDLACSPAVPCGGMTFEDINVTVNSGAQPQYLCSNVASQQGLSSACACYWVCAGDIDGDGQIVLLVLDAEMRRGIGRHTWPASPDSVFVPKIARAVQ